MGVLNFEVRFVFLNYFSCKQVTPKVENFESSSSKKSLANGYSEKAEDISINVTGLPPSYDENGIYRMSVSGSNLAAFALKYGPQDSIDCLSSQSYTTHKLDEITIIDISNMASGDYSLCVIGGSKSSVWQKYSDATTHVWTYNKVESNADTPSQKSLQ